MNILTFTGAVLIMCVLIITVRQLKPEMSLLLAIAGVVILTAFLISFASPLFDEITAIAQAGGVEPELVMIAVKAVGICMIIQTAASVCRDTGQTALAGNLELGGRLALLIVALPLFKRLLTLAMEMIGK